MSLMTHRFVTLLLSDKELPVQRRHRRPFGNNVETLSPAARTLTPLGWDYIPIHG
jgi:hypothetical protein